MNQQKIAIVVDSGCDVPEEWRKRYGMYLLPLRILYEQGEYLDGVEISSEEVYQRLPQEIPKTSLPSGGQVTDCLDQIKADGYEKVLAVTLSSGLSGTYNLVQLIAQEYEGLDIHVVDTKNIAIGSGFTAILAGQCLEQGMEWEALKATIDGSLEKSKVFFCLATLEYLQKGGRIGLVASLVGNALGLKPIISCNEDGVYYVVSKAMGRKQSIHRVMEMAWRFAADGKRYNVAIVNASAKEEAAAIKEELLPHLPGRVQLIESDLGPALGVHVGPGLLGVGIQLLD